MTHHLDDSECESLVNREVLPAGSYTEGNSVDNGSEEKHEGDLRETDYVDADVSVLSQFHEDALIQVGFGLFQWLLFIVLGLGLAADAIEVFVIAYILPSAERDFCMNDERKGWLVEISFFGMMIGGVVWGTLGDRLGRRRTLFTALATNAVFAVTTAFMPTYGLFMMTRLISGIGVGGSLPIVFTYYGEFLTKRHRGRHLSWLLMFWAFGGVFAALLAWAIIPHQLPHQLEINQFHMSSWRIFLLVCATPAVIATCCLLFLPESPRFLLEVGKEVEAMRVYQKIFKLNHKSGAEYQLSELELPSRQQANNSSDLPLSFVESILKSIGEFWNSFMQILFRPYTHITLILLVVWMTTAFGFYGMAIWFPEYIRKIEQEEYDSRAEVISNKIIKNEHFHVLLENVRFVNIHFAAVHFGGLLLNHCVFKNCTFNNCMFDNVRSSRSFFIDSLFRNVTFEETDLYDYRFIGCVFFNSTFRNTVDGCGVDFDLSQNLSSTFLQNLVTQLAIIPGSVLSSYAIDRIGRVRIMSTSLFLTSISAFCIWFLNTPTSVVIFEAVFNFLAISGWNAVDVITTEIYPASLRSTGYGFLSAVSRLAAILGSSTFARYISISKAMPILTTAAVLLIGSMFSVKLPETKDSLM